MVLQPLLHPNTDICDTESMYFRRSGHTLSLETYFNAFSIGKWLTYTEIDNLTLHIRTEYELGIQCYNAVGTTLPGCNEYAGVQTFVDVSQYVSVRRTELPATISKVSDGYRIAFTQLPADGIIYTVLTFPFDLDSYDLRSLISGCYSADYTPSYSPYIALGICTYKREEFLIRNLQAITDNIINNHDSPLNGHIEIFVADNGNTLDNYPDVIPCEHIRIFPNPNTGGAGGFTRTMLEAVVNPASGASFTHMLLMDDDIVLDTAVLERTYAFLSCIKDEYKYRMLGASMFDLNRRYLQMEKGGRSDGYTYTLFHKYFDMRNADFVSANEVHIPASYSGWWYCCIPASFIRRNNLPLPMFLHYDDVEYGTRAGTEPLLLNGICVWHPPVATKGAASIEYYDIRNSLIMQAASKACTPSPARTFLQISFLSVGELFRYRYNVAEARLMGYDDFHLGPKNFEKMNPAKLHSKLSSFNYAFITPSEAGISDDKLRRFTNAAKKSSGTSNTAHSNNSSLSGYLLCALCHLLPPVGGTVIKDSNGQWLPFFARRVYVYNASAGKGYIVERSYRRLFAGIRHYIRTAFHILKDYHRDIRRWKRALPYLRSAKYWNGTGV